MLRAASLLYTVAALVVPAAAIRLRISALSLAAVTKVGHPSMEPDRLDAFGFGFPQYTTYKHCASQPGRPWLHFSHRAE